MQELREQSRAFGRFANRSVTLFGVAGLLLQLQDVWDEDGGLAAGLVHVCAVLSYSLTLCASAQLPVANWFRAPALVASVGLALVPALVQAGTEWSGGPPLELAEWSEGAQWIMALCPLACAVIAGYVEKTLRGNAADILLLEKLKYDLKTA